ncbi:hypothetical protein B0H39_002495 [Clostridium beijerinckii]|uniref:hypothetical protein n=1 Tax=Clostridium beijerinckii TaxID=1520 RepID=UPI0014940756|nr:hypothetical protein [Clostridium beijerinckii]NOW84614.1 hypothetical protein [Clostridium beijerinckii]
MSKKIKTIISTLVIVMALSTTAFAAPINTTNTFDSGRGNDVVTQSDGTETQYFETYDNVIYKDLPHIVKTVVQGDKGNTLTYKVNQITNNTEASDVEHKIGETGAYVKLNNIERESGFDGGRLLYSTQPVTVTFNNTKHYNIRSILKAKRVIMDNGSLAYAEIGNEDSQYLVNQLNQEGVSTYEIKDPGLYMVEIENPYAGGGLTLGVYIAQPGENITSNNNSKIAVPTTVDFNVNGKHNSVPAYQLNGSNYIRVRDLAYILKDTASKVSVYHNNGTDVTTINTVAGLGNPTGDYTADGTELSALPAYTMSAEPSIHHLAKNGSKIAPSMYTINGQDFVNLKALGSILGLNMQVNSDGIMIDTSKPAVSSSPIVAIVDSSAIGYNMSSDTAKILGYPTVDVANKSTEQIMSELVQFQGITTVKVLAPKYTSELLKAMRTKYTVIF